MNLLALFFAITTSTIFIILYVKIHEKYFSFRRNYFIGIFLFLVSIYIQFLTAFFKIDIGVIALLSFLSYPISLSFIFKTRFLNILYLSLNAILKIYVAFIMFGGIFAAIYQVQYSAYWLNNNFYFNLSQGSAYLLSIGSLLLTENFLIKDTLKYFFQLKRNLLLIIFIQTILLFTIIFLSVSQYNIPYVWYNNIIIIVALSFDIVYFLLRHFTSKSSYYSTYKTHTLTLRKQLELQLVHYKTYESKMNVFLKFKHDQDKIINAIANHLSLEDYQAVKNIVEESKSELLGIDLIFQKFSNNKILDALLNDYVRRFESIGVPFKSFIHLPDNDMTELHLIKLFYNILENIFEALLLISDVNNRFLEITSTIVDKYVKIHFINSTTTELSTNLKTSKEDNFSHGFGIQIIDEIIKKYDGFSNRYTLKEDNSNYYHLELFLPIK